MDLVRTWLPLLVIVGGVAGLMIHGTRSYKRQIDRVQTINDEILANNRQMVAELSEIKEILKGRN